MRLSISNIFRQTTVWMALFVFSISFSKLKSETCGWEQSYYPTNQVIAASAEAQNYSQNTCGQRSQGGGVITIPVHITVVHNGESIGTGTNLSDAQLQSQLVVLNHDFRRLNADTANTPQVWKAIAADPEIEFCLAQQNPNGVATSGIDRINGGQTSYTQAYFDTVIKPQTTWNRSFYLNIWTCNLTGGIVGYALPPGAPADRDGVVVKHTAFGTTGNVALPYNKGRVATHEIGHWLGLNHTWGLIGGCFDDDGIGDTPLQNQSYTGCPTHPQSSCGSDDMFMNFMDYADDICLNLFTTGQANMMQSVLNTSRLSIQNSSGCLAPGSPPTAAFVSNRVELCAGDSVFFQDVSQGADAWSWSFPGGIPSTSSDQHPVVFYPNGGQFDVTLVASNNYGSDFSVQSMYLSVDTVNAELPFLEGFENASTIPNFWSVENPHADLDEWIINTAVGGFGNSSNSIYFENFGSVGNESDRLLSPIFDFSLLDSAELHFDFAYASLNGLVADSLVVSYSVDCGHSWNRLWAKGGQTLATASNTSQAFVPLSSQWQYAVIDIIDLNFEPFVQFAFTNVGDGGNNLYLDNINIPQIPPAPPIAAIQVSDSSGCPGSIFTFTDLSTNLPTSRSWWFEGGNPVSSSDSMVTVIYDSSGLFDVRLIVINSDGTDTLLLQDVVEIYPEPQVNFTVSNISCFGRNDGSVLATGMDGTPPYIYTWSGGQTQSQILNLQAGIHGITVTDQNQCSVTDSANINEPALLQVSSIETQPFCSGVDDGVVDISVAGGTSPYSFSWSTGDTDEDILNLGAGLYFSTVTDNKGCQQTITRALSYVSGVNANLNSVPTSCGDSVGSVSATVLSGISPYQYGWNTGATTASISALPTGIYSLTITDSLGCLFESSSAVSESGAPQVSVASTNVSCHGSLDGSATAVVSGGQSPYTVNWLVNPTQTGMQANNLQAGNYWVEVIGSDGCSDFQSFGIVEPSPLLLSLQSSPASCSHANGSVLGTVSGGNGPYTYFWSDGATTLALDSVVAGNYILTLTDISGCVIIDSMEVLSSLQANVSFSGSNITCSGGTDGSASVQLINGTPPFTFHWSEGSTSNSISGLIAGIFWATVTDANGCADLGSITLSEPSPITITGQISDATCDSTNGAIDAIASGGNGAPFEFVWNTGDTSALVVGLAVGNYSTTAFDALGCARSTTFSISQQPPPTANLTIEDVSCFGFADGTITVQAFGSPPIRQSIDGLNFQSNPVFSNLDTGFYTITLEDVNGCRSVDTASIHQPLLLFIDSFQITGTNPINAEGIATVFASGGVPPFSYSWSDPLSQTTQTATNLAGGDYQITISDDNGCTLSTTINIPFINGLGNAPDEGTAQVFDGVVAGTFILEFTGSSCFEMEVIIHSVDGRSVELNLPEFRNRSGYRSLKLDLRHFPPGLYIVELQCGFTSFLGRLLKSH